MLKQERQAFILPQCYRHNRTLLSQRSAEMHVSADTEGRDRLGRTGSGKQHNAHRGAFSFPFPLYRRSERLADCRAGKIETSTIADCFSSDTRAACISIDRAAPGTYQGILQDFKYLLFAGGIRSKAGPFQGHCIGAMLAGDIAGGTAETYPGHLLLNPYMDAGVGDSWRR